VSTARNGDERELQGNEQGDEQGGTTDNQFINAGITIVSDESLKTYKHYYPTKFKQRICAVEAGSIHAWYKQCDSTTPATPDPT